MDRPSGAPAKKHLWMKVWIDGVADSRAPAPANWVVAAVAMFGMQKEIKGSPGFRAKCLMANPATASTLKNKTDLHGGVVICHRGETSFLAKAALCQAAGARAVIFVNTDDGYILAGPKPQDSVAAAEITIPCACLKKQDGEHLERLIGEGSMVGVQVSKDPFVWKPWLPKKPAEEPQPAAAGPADQAPPTQNCDLLVQLSAKGEPKVFEATVADFGGRGAAALKVRKGLRGNLRLVVVVPPTMEVQGVLHLMNDQDLAGAVAFIQRGGGIPFADKARRAKEAGAEAVVFYNTDRARLTPGLPKGAEPVDLLSVCVSKADGDVIREGFRLSRVSETGTKSLNCSLDVHSRKKERRSHGSAPHRSSALEPETESEAGSDQSGWSDGGGGGGGGGGAGAGFFSLFNCGVNCNTDSGEVGSLNALLPKTPPAAVTGQ